MLQGTLKIPFEFQTSYNDFQNYPINLIYKVAYSGFINAYMERLRDQESKLFLPVDHSIATLDYNPTSLGDTNAP